MGAVAEVPRVRHHETREKDVAALYVDGRICMVDTADFILDGKTEAVVLRHDGSIGIEKPKRISGRYTAGERQGFYNFNHDVGWAVFVAQSCIILGRLIRRG